MSHWKIMTFLSLLYLIWAVPQRSSAASLFHARRNLALQGDKFNRKPVQEASPSPSPGPAVAKSNSGDGYFRGNPPKTEASPSPSPGPEAAKSKSVDHNIEGNEPKKKEVVAQETCDLNFQKCHDDVTNVTACLLPKDEDANSGLFLLVHNDGQRSVKLNVTLLPVNSSQNDVDILAHKVRKINVSSIASGSSSIVVNAGNWSCVIERGVRIPLGLPSYTAYVKPINGAYLLLATALLIGVMWACCKIGRDGRHLNGVPYQELEMGQQGSGSSRNVETLEESWDQSWDDDWDEEVTVKSPGGNHLGSRRANGVDSNGWGSDWNDQ
ncbi:uncharacterized protein [Coffea arabica]|uniref:DUF7356 domain-containing protein n=1 Tax=Coffea arabica TaxID=13443 RepID=A0A6P6W7S5_COFAR|nr:uncharacterized protein LOC113730245 [Coffea arabica]